MFLSFLIKKTLFIFFFLTLFICQTQAFEKLVAKKIISNLDGVVWAMTFINKDEMLITLKSGKILLLNINTKSSINIKNVPRVLYEGQGGLLDIVKSPNFINDKFIYITYVKDIHSQGVTTLARAKFVNKQFQNWQDLLVTKSNTKTTRHFGSRIAFDEEGHVFFTIGDRGIRKNAQNLSNHAGSTIRLSVDGSIPKDNPFVNDENILDEIYSHGHRNAQGLFYDKVKKTLFLVEHGPRGGDEINEVNAGANYGWPVISYGKEYWNPMPVGIGTHKVGMKQPLKVYIPSIAPSSLVVYYGDKYSSLNGKILVGALKLRHINVLKFDKNLQSVKETTRLFEDLNERIRSITKSSDNYLYFSTDSGNIYQIIEKY